MEYVMTGNPRNGTLDKYHLIIAPSYACNLSCGHCYNGQIEDRVSQDQWKAVIGKWADFVRAEGKEGIVHFKGGEPFSYEGLDGLLEHSADKGLLVFVTSNGTLIGDEQAQNLGDVYKRTKGKIILSLNGSRAETDELLRPKGAYEKTVEAAERLRKHQVPFDINYVVHSGNEGDVERAVYLAKELGAVQFNLLPLIEKGSVSDNNLGVANLGTVLEQIERAMDERARDMLIWSVSDMIHRLGSGEYECNGCTAGFRGLAYITPDGNVFSCPNTVMEEYRLGTVEDSFEKLFENARNLREIHQGRLICKGELEANKDRSESMRKLVESEELIKHRIRGVKTTSQKRKPIALCFNRNW